MKWEAHENARKTTEAFARHIGYQIDDFVLCCGEESRIGDDCPECGNTVHRFDFDCLCTPCERIRHDVREFCAPASARETLKRLPVIVDDSPAMQSWREAMGIAWE